MRKCYEMPSQRPDFDETLPKFWHQLCLPLGALRAPGGGEKTTQKSQNPNFQNSQIFNISILLKYNTSKMSENSCKCGRSFKIASKIIGRNDQFLIGIKGNFIPSINIYTFFAGLSEVKRFQGFQRVQGLH